MSSPGDGDGPLSGWFRPEEPVDGATGTPGPATPPALPPALSPRGTGGSAARRVEQRRHPVVRRMVGTAAALVVLGSAAGYVLTDQLLGEVNHISPFPVAGDRPERVDVPAENILVAGVDQRDDLTPKQRRKLHVGQADYGRHSDTMMLMHVSDRTRSISAISFPRDSLVTIPAYTDANGTKRARSTNKINAAYSFGGPELTIRTVEKATGIRIDHYVEVDIPGFVSIVDAVGGVEVCTEKPLYDKDSGLDLPAGISKLDGAEGLAFVRARHLYADQDLGRIRAQQRFIGSMVKKATSTFNPIRLRNVLSKSLKSLTTSMDEGQILEHAERIRDYNPQDIRFFTVPISDPDFRVDGVGSSVLWDEAAAETMFERIRRDEPLVTPTAEKVTVAPGSITLQVLNGAGIQGLAGRAADDLALIGFGMAGPAANADVTGMTGTVVRHDPAREKAARTVLAALPGSTAEPVEGLGRTIEVVVGSDYETSPAVKVSIARARPKGDTGRSAAEDICA